MAGALREAAALRAVGHDGLTGELRELLIGNLLAPLLPPTVGVSSGIIISSENQQSPQTDIIIYDKMVLPPFLLAEKGLVPVEAVLFSIEVKSELDAANLRGSDSNARVTAAFRVLPPVRLSGEEAQAPTYATSSALFAFGSDLRGGGKTEIGRYEELLAGSAPALHMVCVAGRGLWRQVGQSWLPWPCHAEHDEVIGFLASILNTLPGLMGRRPPPMGRYVSNGS